MAKYSEAQKKAVIKYVSANYDRVYLKLRKDSTENKNAVQDAADKAGESLNSYIVTAIRQRIDREKSPE